MLTELDIINRMLPKMGYTTVSQLTSDIEVVDAQQIFNEVDKDIQSMKWAFNTESLTLLPDTLGEILLPSNVLSTDPEEARYVRRNGKLYDIPNNTYAINKSVVVEIATRLNIEDVPPPVAQYIAAEAVLRYVTYNSAEATVTTEAGRESIMARANAFAYELAQKKTHLRDSPTGRRVLGA